MIIFGAAANTIVIFNIEPSYTSLTHKWNGAAPILNSKTTRKNSKPENRNESCCVKANENNDSNEVKPKSK